MPRTHKPHRRRLELPMLTVQQFGARRGRRMKRTEWCGRCNCYKALHGGWERVADGEQARPVYPTRTTRTSMTLVCGQGRS